MAWKPKSTDRPSVNQQDSFTFAATGDASIHRCMLPYEGVSDRFDGLLEVMRSTDATVANLETVVHDYQHPPADVSGTIKRTPPEAVDDMLGMGIDMVTAANNHIFDYGAGGLEVTMEELESRGMAYAGIGNDLFEARQPGYRETAAGRVALISATSKIQQGSVAGDQTPALQGRPGVNPLRVEKVYDLTREHIEGIRSASEALGIEDIKRRMREAGDRKFVQEGMEAADFFHFEGLKFREVETDEEEGVGYEPDEDDTEEIRSWVEEASKTSNWVLTGLHTHDGVGGRRHTEVPPEYLVDLAHEFVDAGADSFIGNGTNVVRGIEIYQGKPVFYSLGNFIYGRPLIPRFPPSMYDRWGLEDYTKPSSIYDARFLDEDGRPKDQLALPKKWETIVPRCTFGPDGKLERCEVHPVVLQRMAPQPQRGIPVLADGEEGREIVERVARLSEAFGTHVEIVDGVGVIEPE